MRSLIVWCMLIGVCVAAGAAEVPADETFVGQGQCTKQYDYWENGKERECRIYDAEGTLIVKSSYCAEGTLEQRELFNRRGDIMQRCYYGPNGKLHEGIDGWAAMQRSYYGDGTIALENYYGEDGYIKERKHYSMAGNLVDTQYYGDDDIDPNEEFNPYLLGGTTQEFFDSYGHLEATAAAYQE